MENEPDEDTCLPSESDEDGQIFHCHVSTDDGFTPED